MSIGSWKIATVGVIAALAGIGGLSYITKIQPVPTPEPGVACPSPPSPVQGNEAKIDLALTETIAVFRGEANPKVMDVFPKEARNLQMIEHLTCKAAQRGLISNTEELLAYTERLESIILGKTLPKTVQHEGTLGALKLFLPESKETDLILTFAPGSEDLARFEIGTISAPTWRKLMDKMCAYYAKRFSCSWDENNSRRMIIEKNSAG